MRLFLRWVERGGPELTGAPQRRGFGSAVIDASVRGQLRGTVDCRWERAGLRYEVSMPAEVVLASPASAASDATDKDVPASDAAAKGPAGSLRGRRVMLVEDEPIVALEGEATLVELGCHVVGPAGTLEAALRLAAAEAGGLDAAVLDVNLHGELSMPVAHLLAGYGVPVIYVTGYDTLPQWGGPTHGSALLRKPLRAGELAAALRQILAAPVASARVSIPAA